MGSEPSIFSVATVDRLVKWTMNHNTTLDEDYVRRSATMALAHFYDKYQHRFGVIGHPQDHMLPLILKTSSTVIEYNGDVEPGQERRPLPEVQWKSVVY